MPKVALKVADYMTPNPHSIGLHDSLAKAYAKLHELQIRQMTVLLGGKLVGLLAAPNLRTVEALKDADLTAITVKQAMTPVPYAVTEDARLDEVAREMASQRYECAVVMRDATVVGIFTTVDALRALADLLGGAAPR